MATREQKIAALETALAQASGKSEAEIFLIMTEALAKISEGETTSALFLLQTAPMTDAQKAKALELQEQSLTLARSVLCPSS